jgi:hypothetical protein
VREIPEEMKPRRIAIDASDGMRTLDAAPAPQVEDRRAA